MLKFLTTLIVIVVIAVVSVLVYTYFYGAQFAANYLSKMINLPVSIEKVELSWKHVNLAHVDVKNVDDSPVPSAFKADLVSIHTNPLGFLKNLIRIQEVSIDNATVGIEMKNFTGSENNWENILNSLFAYDTSSEKQSRKKVIIDVLTVHKLTVQAKHHFFGPFTILLPTIPLIEVDNVTANTPLTIAEALNVVFRSILTPVSEKEGFGFILTDVEELPPSLKEIFSQQERKAPSSTEGKKWEKIKNDVNDILDEVGDFFNKLFNKEEKNPTSHSE